MGRNNVQGRKYNEERLRKAVKNFNAKVKRVLAKTPELAPHKLSYATIKRNIRSQDELRKEIQDIEKFNKKGGEKGTIQLNENVKVSRWEYNRAKRKLKIVNEQRKAQNQELYNTYTGERVVGGIKVRKSPPQRVTQHLNENAQIPESTLRRVDGVLDWHYKAHKYENRVHYESLEARNEQYRKNLLKAVDKVYKDVPKDKLNKLKSLINGLSNSELQDIYYQESVEADVIDIRYHYDEPNDIMERIDWAIKVLSK